MVAIEIENQQKRIALRAPRVIRVARKILKHERVRQAHLSIVFVTDRKIQAVNKKFLKRDHPTDVLAFELTSPLSSSKQDRRSIDGEIIISAVTAYHNAKRFKTSPEYEVMLYMAHGILHLLRYDDHTPQDRERMRAREKELMGLIFS